MTRIVGKRDRSEWVADPAEALRRGRRLDAMLSAAQIPVVRGVQRCTHADFNRFDDERALQAAMRLNPRRSVPQD